MLIGVCISGFGHVLVQFSFRSLLNFYLVLGWNWGAWGLKKHNVALSSFPMRSLTWRSPAAVRVIRLRREVHAKACAKQDMFLLYIMYHNHNVVFSFLPARLSLSNLAFTNFPNMSLQPYPSHRSFLKKNARGLWRGWLGNWFSQPDLVRHRRCVFFSFQQNCFCVDESLQL